MNWEELPTPYSIAHMADDVLDILDQVGVRRCHFVGHALGGLVGLDLALRAPERLSSWSSSTPGRRSTVTRGGASSPYVLLEHGGAEAYLRAQPISCTPLRGCLATRSA